MPLDRTQPGIAELFASIPTTGTAVGNVPTVPVPMASMSNPVKATIDAITAQGGPTWIATLATQAYVAAQITALIAGAPGALNTLKELADALGDDASFSATLANTLSALSASVATKSTANETTSTLDFGFASGNEGDICKATISAAWVTAQSRIVCLPSPTDSADHSTDETLAEDIRFSAVSIIPGTSFDVVAVAPNGTWGRHNCSILAI